MFHPPFPPMTKYICRGAVTIVSIAGKNDRIMHKSLQLFHSCVRLNLDITPGYGVLHIDDGVMCQIIFTITQLCLPSIQLLCVCNQQHEQYSKLTVRINVNQHLTMR
ncbi:hypothetical protein BDBG_17136 [Blastomyces gilchristii SLH14081]|uniref:Uncharacterized protein n=2 Tax=Blastomyces TaxID=229219 RepID=A0A179ULV1_BLAGS|nr:uncharacterized protein BDBG_17136 [Blastomyces gilchristii SLH14081]EQL37254.1 hypothetical protein BDFG_01512 [Blastomyces dermatitidis ATCC 26199]KMW66912.1 hypothetical protein BDDG_11787 [Blastomyces dermatitidis ATCC 18188]OAT08944.1 hypothetical protein BDBG_17136 [Blastomyces gilchristii SLH14081]